MTKPTMKVEVSVVKFENDRSPFYIADLYLDGVSVLKVGDHFKAHASAKMVHIAERVSPNFEHFKNIKEHVEDGYYTTYEAVGRMFEAIDAGKEPVFISDEDDNGVKFLNIE